MSVHPLIAIVSFFCNFDGMSWSPSGNHNVTRLRKIFLLSRFSVLSKQGCEEFLRLERQCQFFVHCPDVFT